MNNNEDMAEQVANFTATLIVWSIFAVLFCASYYAFGWNKDTPIIEGAFSGRLEKAITDVMGYDSLLLAILSPIIATGIVYGITKLLRSDNVFWVRIANIATGAIYNLAAFCLVAFVTIVFLGLAKDVPSSGTAVILAAIYCVLASGLAAAFGKFINFLRRYHR